MKFRVGDLVRYKDKNEIGLIGEVLQTDSGLKLRCWWHTGGTRSVIDALELETLTLEQILTEQFNNEYAKPSMLERQLRILEKDGPTGDLIAGSDIRPFVNDILGRSKCKKDEE